jgi:hypothetical protein
MTFLEKTTIVIIVINFWMIIGTINMEGDLQTAWR